MKYQITLCTNEDLPTINRIMESIDHEINTDDIFVKDTFDFIKKHITDQGFIVKVTHNTVVVAFLIVRFPKDANDNLGKDINLQDNKLSKVAHIESLAVVPKFRGKRLGQKMIKFADQEIKKRNLDYSMATVSPKNKYSLITFLKHDYEVVKLKDKYSGVKRLILLKKHKKRS